jgi:hypothetical protein
MRFGGGPQVAPEVAELPETFWVEPFRLLDGNLRDWEIKDKIAYRGFPHWRPDTRILGEPFSPLDLPNLAAWYDASKITGLSDGAAVETWEDSSGNGNDVTQGTADERPTYQTSILNGLPVVRFDGIDDILSVFATLAGAQPYTVYAVVAHRSGSVTSNEGFCGGYAALPYLFVRQLATDAFAIFAGTIANGPNSDTDFHVFGGLFDGASSILDLDGSETVVNAGTSAFGAEFSIGGYTAVTGPPGDPFEHSDSDVAELVVCSGGLTADERTTLRNYFTNKYAL